MGLDISAYSKLTRVADEQPDDYPDSQVWLWANVDFPGREEGAPEGLYAFEKQQSVLSLGYGSYSVWRETLAKLAGYEGGANECWGRNEPGPFVELINFSDCEGTLGPVVCAKLVRDFDSYAEKASAIGGDWYSKYQRMHAAFRLAADGGAVRFS